MYIDTEYVCDECGSAFRWEFMISAHVRYVHRLAYENAIIPNLTFEQKKLLKAHIVKDSYRQTLDFLEIFARKYNLDKESVYRHAKIVCKNLV